jgi:hypothetical protein
MNRLFRKLLFLWVGNICMWIYNGGRKTMQQVAEDDNEILGLIVTVILGFLLYFYFR